MKGDESMSLTHWMDAGATVLPNLLLKHFKTLGLTHDELILIIQLKSYIDMGDEFPDSVQVAKRMNATEEEVFHLIHQLMQKKVIQLKVKKTADGKTQDYYSMDFLWEKLLLAEANQDQKKETDQETESKQNLFTIFEQEFSRPLSPIEIQTIGMWLEDDHYEVSLIEYALREAVLNQVYSLKYIDRILLSWEKKNIRTRAQAEKESEMFNKRRQPTNTFEASDNDEEIPLHDWLNN